MVTQRIHANELLDEILNLFESNLKTSLSLVGVYRGGLSWLPPQSINTMANGIWAELVQNTDIREVTLPKGLQVGYKVRLTYVRKLDLSSNVDRQRIADAESIIEMVYNNYQLATINPPLVNGQVLWWLPRTIEWQPPEDNFVQAISADLTAIAINCEIEVRTGF